jgi:shikimate dehydrogenase
MTDRYAVIGHPISHSKSPVIHSAFARATGQDIEYTAIEGPLDGFATAATAFRDNGGRGMNITAPFKLQAFELATDRTERAQLAGAVNCLKFEGECEGKHILADNFDGLGLVNDIQHNLGFAMRGKQVLLLGAGGAARGVLQPFLEQQPAALVIANRTVAKAHALAEQFAAHGPVSGCGYPELEGRRFDLVVNATSASLSAELPPITADVFNSAGLAYEMVYGKGLTPFLRLAQNAGVHQLADGVGMLVEQAAEAFLWWRGVRPDTKSMIATITVPLQ